MNKIKNLNETKVRFSYKKKTYEVDKLLDSSQNFGKTFTFEVFDVSDGCKGESVGFFEAIGEAHKNYLIKGAKLEIVLTPKD